MNNMVNTIYNMEIYLHFDVKMCARGVLTVESIILNEDFRKTQRNLLTASNTNVSYGIFLNLAGFV